MSSKAVKTYYFAHGLLGNSLHIRPLRKYLKAKGYIATKTINSADMVLAHSGGYIQLDPDINPGLLFLLAPALNTDDLKQTFNRAGYLMKQTAKTDQYGVRHAYWKTLNIISALRSPQYNYKMVQLFRSGADMPTFNNVGQIIIIANRHDPWPQANNLEQIVIDNNWIGLSLSGSHEHIRVEPEQYADIIDIYAKRFLAKAK